MKVVQSPETGSCVLVYKISDINAALGVNPKRKTLCLMANTCNIIKAFSYLHYLLDRW